MSKCFCGEFLFRKFNQIFSKVVEIFLPKSFKKYKELNFHKL